MVFWEGQTGASPLVIDALKRLAFLDLRPSGNREEAALLLGVRPRRQCRMT